MVTLRTPYAKNQPLRPKNVAYRRITHTHTHTHTHTQREREGERETHIQTDRESKQ